MRRAGVIAAAALLALAGCAREAPEPAAAPQPRAALPTGGERLAALYVAVEAFYRADRRFRTDYDPLDAPYDADTLVRNFVTVALRSETQVASTEVITEGRNIPLSRWERPVSIHATGASPADLAHLEALLERVRARTGLEIGFADEAGGADITLVVADPDERARLIGLEGARADRMLSAWPRLAQFPCIAKVLVDPETKEIDWGLILIKAELQGEYRRACLTEELVQSLGLFNDAPDVRPSIFNDDAEFVALTRHDEDLLDMLYDPVMRSGMTEAEAAPLARIIAADLIATRSAQAGAAHAGATRAGTDSDEED